MIQAECFFFLHASSLTPRLYNAQHACRCSSVWLFKRQIQLQSQWSKVYSFRKCLTEKFSSNSSTPAEEQKPGVCFQDPLRKAGPRTCRSKAMQRAHGVHRGTSFTRQEQRSHCLPVRARRMGLKAIPLLGEVRRVVGVARIKFQMVCILITFLLSMPAGQQGHSRMLCLIDALIHLARQSPPDQRTNVLSASQYLRPDCARVVESDSPCIYALDVPIHNVTRPACLLSCRP